MAGIAPEDAFFAADVAAWREWLAAHHRQRTQVWLLLHKKHVQDPCIGYDEAVEEALCWGWVDGRASRWDERSYAVRFTPRKPGSVWSESNVARVERLIDAGRMTPAGLALVEEAKRRGTWDRAERGRFDVMPPDLEAALDGVPAAAARWQEWPASPRRQYISWVLDARRAETRARRIADVVRRTAAGLKPGEKS